MSDELKPCPFCGSTNISTEVDEMQGTKWGFAACECSARGPEVRTSYNMSSDAPWRKDAIAAWNDRPAELESAQSRDACQHDNFSSLVCQYGTRGCVAEHAASAQSSQQGAVAREDFWLIHRLDLLHVMSVAIGAAYTSVEDGAKRMNIRCIPAHPHATESDRRDAWISVDERLPEEGQDVVFIVHADASSIQAHLNGRVLGGRFLTVGGYPTFTVPGLGFNASHWMPLPAAPAALSQMQEPGGEL